jgi:peptidyl-prolyl cis-trans isomerase C
MNKHLVLIPAALLLSLTVGLTGCNKKSESGTTSSSSEPSAASSTPAASGPVAKVNGKEIPGSLADLIIKDQLPPGTPITDDLRAKIKDHLVQREILLQAAREAGFDKRDDVKAHQAFAADDELLKSYIKNWSETHKPTDADIKAFYDKKIAELGDTEYKARHILVDNEDAAKAIIAKLDKGAKFADLAKDSKDPGSRDKGGALDWSMPGNYAPEFAAALKELQKGKYTAAPVKTQFGYHVILLEDTRKAANLPKFEDVKDQLAQQVAQETMKKYFDDLKAKAKIE